MTTIYHYLRDFSPESPRFNTGMEKAVSGLAAEIAAIDPSAHSTVLCEGPKAVDIQRPEGFRVICFDNTSVAKQRFSLAPALRRFVEEEIQDSLVVLNAIFHSGVWLFSHELRRMSVPFIVAPHDPYHPAIFEGNRLKKEIYWRLFERPMLRGAAAVQVLDRRHQQYLIARGVNTPYIEVVNGYVPEEVPDESRLEWRSDGPIKILFLGRIDRINKGVDLLVEAFTQISRSNSQVHLTVQGPDHGDAAMIRQQVAQAGLSDRIDVFPPDYKTIPTELAARFDLFVLPSRFEGFGLSALEAMLAGRPIIISEIAGLAPHVQKCDGGVVVEASVESIKAGIEQLIARRSEWREIGMRGRKYVLENLNWSRIAQDALVEYRKILNGQMVEQTP
ncbi:MAG: glycosyltransferase [Anaerolineae bacterium]|nr:glycosyltransferase [Phycisphaerae bacterium]